MRLVSSFVWVLLATTLFILLSPIIVPLTVAFSEREVISFPPTGFTLKWFYNAFKFKSLVDGFKLSLYIGFAASSIAMALSLPASYALFKYSFKGKSIIENIFLAPSLMPEIVLSYLLLIYLIAFARFPGSLALLLGHILIITPYAMRYVYASLVNLSKEIEEAAVSLGAHPVRAFLDVVVPNVKNGLVAGFITSFVVSFNAFSISLFLSYGAMPLPIAMWNYLQVRYDPTIAALSCMLILFTVTLTIIARRIVSLRGV